VAEELYKRYAREIHDQLGYGVSWAPSSLRELGEVGEIEDGVFVSAGNVSEIGIAYQASVAPAPEADWLYQSRGSTEISLKAAGATDAAFQHVATAQAGARIAFSREYAVVLAMHEARIKTLANKMAFSEALLKKYVDKELEPKQIVLVEVVETLSTTLLVSTARNAEAELTADADLGGIAKIGDVSAGLGIAYARAMGVQLVATTGVTPLYRATGLKRSFFTGNARLEAQLGADADASEYLIDVFPVDYGE
jgi:adenosyl cobinamide kinase/adenosyl cobinamide phosphate guanylyltransferase